MSSAYAPTVLADAPIAYWRLGDVLGSLSAVDAIAGRNGAVTGGVTFGQAGAVSDGDTAALFDGVNGLITVAAAAVLNSAGALSVEAWVNTSAQNHNGGIFEKTIGGAVNSSYLLFQEGTNWNFRIRQVAGALFTASTPVTLGDVGAWVHLVGTYDGTTIRLYKNGVQIATTPHVGAIAVGVGISISGELGGGIYPFVGGIDEISVFTTVLSAAQILAHYQAAQPFLAALARGSNAYLGPAVPPGGMNA